MRKFLFGIVTGMCVLSAIPYVRGQLSGTNSWDPTGVVHILNFS